MEFRYGLDQLDIDIVHGLAEGSIMGRLAPEAIEQIKACRQKVEQMVAADKAVYGINTGFGPLCDTQISADETSQLQENLLITHAVGVGAPIDSRLSKIMMICKVHALSQGYSGARLELIERILYFIDNDLLPAVPCQGSVGASGDLAPLSHLFLPLLGEGDFIMDGQLVPAKEVLAQHNLAPLTLAAKEGLALINGTQFILSHAISGLLKFRYLLDLADVSGAMSLEGFQGGASPFKAELHRIRPFPGSIKVAERLRQLLEGSQNLNSHTDCERVQDPYSIRCMPQVHGASRNAYAHLLELVTIEMNAVTDNPIIISAEEAISGGNFHGQPLAMALDYASIAASELGNISDRRSYLLLEGLYGLPRLLTRSGGLNSGYMIPQYTTAALVTENKSLCFPPSADSIPTSLGQEDHVSMGSISGRQFCQILGNVEKILAIELMYAVQAMDFRRPNTFSTILEENYKLIRAQVPMLEDDRILKDDINNIVTLVENQAITVNI